MSASADNGPAGASVAGETRARILVVDNYDSFTHNVVHALELAGADCRVVMNDAEETADRLRSDDLAGIVISAGPCTPQRAGVSLALVRAVLDETWRAPLLGICLGHQAIAQAAGARLRRAKRAMHGKLATIRHDGRGLFAGLPNPLQAARYNSLVVDEATLCTDLEPCAWDDDGELMALRHRRLPVQGVQFHPESWLSTEPLALLRTWTAGLKGTSN